MWKTNLKVLAVAAVVLGFYTGVAHVIPQLQSEVPESVNLGAGATGDQLASAGEKIYNGAGGCGACHGLGTRAPNLLTDEKGTGLIGQRCSKRSPGKSCKEYLYEALTTPNAFVVSGYGPIMPDMRRQISLDQIWAVIAFLESNGGEIDVTGQDIVDAQAAAGAAKPAAPPAGAAIDVPKLLSDYACAGCHAVKGEGGAVGPAFDGIGTRSSADEIRESIISPRAKVAKGFEAMAEMMPANFAQQLSKAELDALVAFLAGLK
jgi:mono/diheme cytochrome c family protein